jgi:hypothetical protein
MREITMRRGAADTFYVADESLPMFAVRAENDADLRLKLAPLLASCCGVEDFEIKLKSAPVVHPRFENVPLGHNIGFSDN